MRNKIIFIFIIGLLSILGNMFYNPTSSTIVESNKYLTPANPAFEDDNFYKCITGNINTYKSDEELANITYLDCNGRKISSVKGIEKLTGLKELRLNNNQISSIDISNNLVLERLSLNINNLTDIDLSKNTLLISLELENNQLTSIDLSNNIELRYVNVSRNYLDSINVSSNLELENLYLSGNKLTSLDISNNTKLKDMNVDENVNIIGLREDLNINYVPTYMFNDQILDFDIHDYYRQGEYEYTIEVGNKIDKIAVSSNPSAKAGYYDCTDETILCGGQHFNALLILSAISDGYLEINGKTIDTYGGSFGISVLGYQQCNNTLPCNIYNNGELIAHVNEDEYLKIYRNNNEVGFYDAHSEIYYMLLSDLNVGKNVLKFVIDKDKKYGEYRVYTINIIRSEGEIEDSNPNEEFNKIIEDIVTNNDIPEDINVDTTNNVINPNTGLIFDIILGIMGIGMIVTIYYIYYRGKVKN